LEKKEAKEEMNLKEKENLLGKYKQLLEETRNKLELSESQRKQLKKFKDFQAECIRKFNKEP